MVGKKQHFIPQFLIRSFAEKGDGRYDIAQVYSRKRGHFSTAPHGVGAERHFYEMSTTDPDGYLDNKITILEAAFADSIAKLRAQASDHPLDQKQTSELLVHLCIRASHMREAFTHGFVEVMHKVSEQIQNSEYIKKSFKLNDPMPSRIVIDIIRSEWEKNKSTLKERGYNRARFEDLMIKQFRDNLGDIEPTMAALEKSIIDVLRASASEAVRKGHIQSLNRSLSPEPRVEQLATLPARVLNFADSRFVLPDCIALGVTLKEEVLPLTFCDAGNLSGYIWPISHRQAIIAGTIPNFLLDGDAFTKHAAENSWDFIVASRKDDRFNEIMPAIGANIRAYLERLIHSDGS
jgi:hypothetical protein